MAAIAGSLERHDAPSWPRRAPATLARALVQAVLLVPVVRWFCRPLVVRGRENLPGGPMLLVANHASHADTAAIIAALPWRVRRRLAPAAAEDYFFSSRAKGASVAVLTGAFPFPRHGSEGIRRARRLLAQGWSVLIFPEGTRSRDGAAAEFKSGVAKLASLGHPVVPVAVGGTHEVLPPGRALPRRSAVAVTFGAPEFLDDRPEASVAGYLRERVRALGSPLSSSRPSLHARAASLAGSRAGLILAFVWGLAEAIAWPLVPDLVVFVLALAAPRRALLLAVAAAGGSVAGGAIAFVLASGFGDAFLAHAPLVTERMTAAASDWLAAEGAGGLGHQAWSGVPYKVFAWQAPGAGIDLGSFVVHTVLARTPRILIAGAVAAGLGALVRRWMDRIFPVFVAAFLAVFALGLARVVAAWS